MEMITEAIIDNVTQSIGEEETDFIDALNILEAEQPVLLPYLFSESFDVLYQEEREYILFLTVVIYHSFKAKFQTIPVVTEEQLGEIEEQNWDRINSVEVKRFRDRLDVFFDQATQEDLLAFAEDALADDEEGESIISPESREPIFIALKSMIDSLEQSINSDSSVMSVS